MLEYETEEEKRNNKQVKKVKEQEEIKKIR